MTILRISIVFSCLSASVTIHMMKAVFKELFRAVHENCWLAVEYRNKKEEKTSYWIAVKNIDTRYRRLLCDGMHLGTYAVTELNLYLDQILSARILPDTYAEIPAELSKEDLTLSFSESCRSRKYPFWPLSWTEWNMRMRKLSVCAMKEKKPFAENMALS